MNDTTEAPPQPIPMRRRPRSYETISIGGNVKWRLDALCLAGRRSRTATIEMLLDAYLAGHPRIRAWVNERARDPRPIRLPLGYKKQDTEETEEKTGDGLTPPPAERNSTP
jgi:hypothetical protein